MKVKIREASLVDYEDLCMLFAEENQFHARLVPQYIQTTPNLLTREELEGFLTDSFSNQGRGMGKRLMEAARHWVVSQGIQSIELHVWDVNTGARHFYESLGLTSVRRRMVWELEV